MSPPQILSSETKDNNRKKVICPFPCVPGTVQFCAILFLSGGCRLTCGEILRHIFLFYCGHASYSRPGYSHCFGSQRSLLCSRYDTMRVTHNIDFYLLDKVFTPPKKTCIQAFFAAGADCSWFEFSFKANLVRVTLPMFDSNQSVFCHSTSESRSLRNPDVEIMIREGSRYQIG